MSRHPDDEDIGKPVRRKTRTVKAAQPEAHREVKAKFVEERMAKIYEVLPKSDNQKKFLDALKTKQLVLS